MSVQAGVWFFDGRPVEREFLLLVGADVAQYGPDGSNEYLLGSLGMIFRPYHTTNESRREKQPYTSVSGTTIMLDGRLDNREDLTSELGNNVPSMNTDVEIAAAAYERWGIDCLGKFVGEWALSLWDPGEKSLILARDYAATRHLYYYVTGEKVLWCTYLASIVTLSAKPLTLNHEYMAGYLVDFPAAHQTPYQEIQAVPPGKFVRLRGGGSTIHPHWVLEPRKTISYKTDEEYEEHFRHLFRQAVRRRLRSDGPILADLSGGFDSSSIVCMADDILAHEGADVPKLDTVSYYDLSEPDGDDFSYFTDVEAARGRTGFRINMEMFGLPFNLEHPYFVATPSLEQTPDLKRARDKIIETGGYRVSLSGMGGDELNGQAAELRVQLADLIVQFRFRELARQLKAWSLLMRRPWIQLLFQSTVHLMPMSVRAQTTEQARLDPWIGTHFARRYQLSRLQLGEVKDMPSRLPSMKDWAMTLASLAKQVAEQRPSVEERRYPFLDRDLVEFLVAIPQDQLLRPGERRWLMRRALRDVLPPKVLARRTKAGGSRCYILVVEKNWRALEPILEFPLVAQFGYVKADKFRQALHDLKVGKMSPYFVRLVRALTLELWLRDVTRRKIFRHQAAMPISSEVSLRDRDFNEPTSYISSAS
jgi:asparagine synthase (glutamine-hydrolysing)